MACAARLRLREFRLHLPRRKLTVNSTRVVMSPFIRLKLRIHNLALLYDTTSSGRGAELLGSCCCGGLSMRPSQSRDSSLFRIGQLETIWMSP